MCSLNEVFHWNDPWTGSTLLNSALSAFLSSIVIVSANPQMQPESGLCAAQLFV